ncbi:MAG: mechanosensitive ion channel [Calditrichaceae bacterium]
MFRVFNYTLMCILLITIFSDRVFGQETALLNQNETIQQSGKDRSSGSITETIQSETPDIEWNISFAKIFWSVIIFIIAFFSIKYFTKLLETLGEQWNNIRLIIKRMIPIIRIASWTFVIYIIIAGVFAPPIETLIAVTASAGIAVGFASQDILKNIFGGIMILFDRPFQVGDKIAVGNYYGEVVQIGLRSVRIVTADDSLISIPNSDLVNQAVSNSNSGEFNCQVVAEFFLPAHINLERLKQIAYLAAVCSKYIYLKKPIAVILKNEIHEGRSMLKMRLKAYVLDLRYEFAFASEMTELVIKNLLDESLIRPEELNLSPMRH